jgi:hypothetical protein
MSGGSFSKANRPIQSGTYFNFDIVAPIVMQPNVGSIVALGITADWGPFKVATTVFSINDYVAKFGGSTTTPDAGTYAVLEAFKGEGVPDFGGASQVVVFRMGGSGAAKATHALKAGTPTGVTISARYEGERGNGLALTVQANATDAANDELLVINTVGGASQVLEKFVYVKADLQSLVDMVNGSSSYVTAAIGTSTGVALTPVTSAALTGGDSGTTLTGADYTAAMDGLDQAKFGVVAFQNLTDDTIVASLKSWVQTSNSSGRRFFLVVGGAFNETISDASDRSDALNDPDIINVGVGSLADNDQLDAGGNPRTLSTAEIAPRVAGIVAGRGDRYSLTYAKLAGIDLLAGPSVSQIVTAYDKGVLVFTRASDALSTVRIEKGISTYTTNTNAAMPRSIYSVPRYVSVMHSLQTQIVAWSDDNLIGLTTVNDETRAAAVGQGQLFMRDYEQVGAIQPGWNVMVDPDPPPSDDDQFIALLISAKFGRSTEQVYWTAQLG